MNPIDRIIYLLILIRLLRTRWAALPLGYKARMFDRQPDQMYMDLWDAWFLTRALRSADLDVVSLT